jgi:hypothetical protein
MDSLHVVNLRIEAREPVLSGTPSIGHFRARSEDALEQRNCGIFPTLLNLENVHDSLLKMSISIAMRWTKLIAYVTSICGGNGLEEPV